MPRPGPLTDTERAEIRRRHAAGESRNAIAKALGRSGSTISGVIAETGGSFARGEQVVAATEARKTDLAARRADLAVRLHDIAERELDKMTAPTLYWDWGGKDHDYDERLQPEPMPADRRAMMSTAATAIDRSLKLVPPKDDAADDARSMVGQLMAGLAQVYREQQASEGAGDAQ